MESSIEPKEHEREAEEEEEEGCRTELDLHISDSIYGNKVSISCVDPQEGGVLFDDTDLPVGTSMVICPEVDFTKHPIFMRHIFERVGVTASLIFTREHGENKRWRAWADLNSRVVSSWFSKNYRKITKFLMKMPIKKNETHMIIEVPCTSFDEIGFTGMKDRIKACSEFVERIREMNKFIGINTTDYMYAKSLLADDQVHKVLIATAW